MAVIQSTSSHNTICTNVSSSSSYLLSVSFLRTHSLSLTPSKKWRFCIYVLVIRLLKYFVCFLHSVVLIQLKSDSSFCLTFAFHSIRLNSLLLSDPNCYQAQISCLATNMWLCALAHLDQNIISFRFCITFRMNLKCTIMTFCLPRQERNNHQCHILNQNEIKWTKHW